jgi:ABC-type phosphate/phosphonate transport system substrate-binding protein
LVARPGLDPAVRRKILATLLSMDQDPEGRRILEGMKIERFSPGDDKAFDSIREMQSWLARGK